MVRADPPAASHEPNGGAPIDRRTLIRRAAIVGGVAWTTPVIVGSLASPAGAATITPGCYRMLFVATSSTCSSGPSVGGTGCAVTGSPCSSPAPSLPSDVVGCLSVTSPAGCSTTTTNAGTAVTFTVSATCDTCTIVAASGRRTSAIGAQCDVSEVIAAGGKSVTFDGTGVLPGLAEWDRFEIWLTCT